MSELIHEHKYIAKLQDGDDRYIGSLIDKCFFLKIPKELNLFDLSLMEIDIYIKVNNIVFHTEKLPIYIFRLGYEHLKILKVNISFFQVCGFEEMIAKNNKNNKHFSFNYMVRKDLSLLNDDFDITIKFYI